MYLNLKPILRLVPVLLAAGALLLAASGNAQAHAHLRAADPPEAIQGNGALQEVRLVFSEPVVARFSSFRAFRLTLPESGVRNLTQLNTLASELSVETRDSIHQEVELHVDLPAQTAEVALHSVEPLPAGAYAVVWRVLSVDGHATSGFHTFVHLGDLAASH